jgi:hypothetical protein
MLFLSTASASALQGGQAAAAPAIIAAATSSESMVRIGAASMVRKNGKSPWVAVVGMEFLPKNEQLLLFYYYMYAQ